MTRIATVLLPFFFLTGCLTPIGDFTVMTTKNVGQFDLEKAHPRGHTHGKSMVFVFLGIPFGQPQIDDALNEAMRYGGAHILMNAQVKTKIVGLYPYIGGVGYQVEGDGYALSHLPKPEKVARPVRRPVDSRRFRTP